MWLFRAPRGNTPSPPQRSGHRSRIASHSHRTSVFQIVVFDQQVRGVLAGGSACRLSVLPALCTEAAGNLSAVVSYLMPPFFFLFVTTTVSPESGTKASTEATKEPSPSKAYSAMAGSPLLKRKTSLGAAQRLQGRFAFFFSERRRDRVTHCSKPCQNRRFCISGALFYVLRFLQFSQLFLLFGKIRFYTQSHALKCRILPVSFLSMQLKEGPHFRACRLWR